MIYQLTNERLLEPTEKFDFTNQEISAKELWENMRDSLIAHNGYGLSCNQVGLKYAMFVMGDTARPTTLFPVFNPKIVHVGDKTEMMEEGCLSLPGIVVKVKRPIEIRVRFADLLGVVRTEVYRGMTARIFQHEFDHLQGKTLLSGLSRLKLDMALRKSEEITE
jgi:peptide deformylase